MFKNQTEGLKRDLYTQKSQMQYMQNLRMDNSAKFEFGFSKINFYKKLKFFIIKLLKLKKEKLEYAESELELNEN